MAVDFSKPPKILVIHGVQTTDRNDFRQHTYIEAALTELLSSPDLHFDEPLDFDTAMFKYEDINDEASYLVQRVLASMTGNSIAGWVVDKAVDLIADVYLAVSEGTAYEQVKQRLVNDIETIHDQQHPLYLVAHSLGSFYALEVINDLMRKFRFATGDKSRWPVHGLTTIGSPLGLDLFRRDVSSLERRKIGANVTTTPRLPWKNFWDRQDPIVTGNLLGYPKVSDFHLKFNRQDAKKKGWSIRNEEINSGRTAHLLAHTAYWTNRTVAQGILNTMYLDRENN